MKRALLLVAPLPLLGCQRTVGGNCGTTVTSEAYVDTRGFDDGGYYDEQACSLAGCALWAGPDTSGNYGCLSVQGFDLGVAHVSCGTFKGCGGGRRPNAWVRVDGGALDIVGAWLAEAAQLEAASVPAFEILAAELRAHDAPTSLIARALESADDERRHARVMTSLARAYGAKPGPVRVIVREPRALEAIARENAVEGLVREAYGARVAIDAAIAADEERHAALAADVHAWLRPRLPYAARLRVDEARDAARAQLVAECAVEPARALRDALGLPDATRAVELARRI